VTFEGRFGGVPHSLHVPIAAILGIYARENGQGMVFDLESPLDDEGDDESDQEDDVPPPDSEPPRPSGRPSLKVVK
jgi:stringent starvation protein B